ncbi:MAG TPA: response regulator [Steroidobacteraceae bacterium]|nr:response regulator [Steroidobacteraceae bacterium]
MDPKTSPPSPGTETPRPPSAIWAPRELFESASLTAQIRATTMVAVLAAVLAVTLLGSLGSVWSARSGALERAERTAAAVAARLEVGGGAPLDILEADPEFLGASYRLDNGRVVARYVRPDVSPEATLIPPPALAWASRPTGLGHWLGGHLALEPIYAGAPVAVGGRSAGNVIVLVDHHWVWRHALMRLLPLPLLLAIGGLIGWLAAAMLQRQVVEPLAQLARTTGVARPSGATPPQEDPVEPVNELTQIATNFDLLFGRLDEYEREINGLRHASAQKVIERTREIEMRLRRAEAMTKSKDEFLANMSHEIRTPMNGVLGMAELLAGTELDRRQRRFVDSMRTAAETMMQIINDILDDSKIEAGKMELTNEPFDVRELAETVGQLYAGRAEMKKLEMIFRIEPTVPAVVVGDALRLRQVLGNLLSNAVKYTNEGEVEIRVGLDDLRNGQCRLHFSVRDTGPGIAEGDRTGVFEPFTQLRTAQRTGGTGLGLSIATRLVKLMGGERIDLNSVVGRGSTFSFVVPFEVREDAPVPDRASDEFSGLRVLVVDDNSTSYMLLEEMLANWSTEVTVLSRARLVGDRMHDVATRGRPFDVVLLDHSLPDATTDDTLRTIRLDPLIAGTYVVLLSALDFNPSFEGTRAIAPDLCLAKPVRAQLLRDALQKSRRPRPEGTRSADDTGLVRVLSERAPPELGLRVLVVDDNEINREVAVAMLEECRCRVEVAAEGRAAVAMVERQPFDAILMDCQMAGMDGYTATQQIRINQSNRGTPPTPIIALTANVLERDRKRALEVGMNGFLPKPFKASQLVEVLRPIAVERGSLRVAAATPSVAPPAQVAVAAPRAAAGAVAKPAPERPHTDTVTSMPPWTPEDAPDILESSAFMQAVEPATTVSRLPVLDGEQVESIRSLGKPQVFERLCEMLFASSKDAFERLDMALEAGDREGVAGAAHALKSPVSNLGGRRLADLLERCETMALEGAELAQLRRAAAGLKAHYAALVATLQTELRRGTGTR